MESIVSPWFVYFVSLADNSTAFFSIVAVGCLVAGGVLLLIAFLAMMMEEYDGFRGHVRKIIKPLLIVFLIASVLSIAIPNKNTLIAMYVANEVTYNRVEKAGEIAGDIKDAIKKDIMDIIGGFDSKKGKKEDK